MTKFRWLGLSAMCILGAGRPVAAQTTYNWNLNAAGNWGVNSNWTPVSGPGTTFPGGIGDIAQFGNVIGSARVVTFDGPRTLGGLVFTNSEFAYTISTTTTTNILTMDNGTAGPATIAMNASTRAVQTINAPINVTDASGLAITNDSFFLLSVCTSTTAGINVTMGSNPLTLAGAGAITLGTGIANSALVGTANLTVTGSGIKTLSGNNIDFTGKVVIGPDGVFAIGSTTAVAGISGADAIQINGGALQFGAAVTLTTTQGITLGAAGGVLQGGSSPTINGVITGTGNLVKLGANTPILNAANDFTGSTLVGDGSLNLGGPSGALTGTSGVTARGVFFILNNTATDVNSDRIRNAATVTTQGASLDLRNLNAGSAVNEIVGNYTLIGLTRMRLTANASQDTTLNAGNLILSSGASVLFRGTNLDRSSGTGGNASIFFSNGAAVQAMLVGGGGANGSSTISILPFAFAGSGLFTTASNEASTAQTLATYTVAGGVRALLTTEFDSSPTSANTNLRVASGVPVAIDSATTVNSLVIDSFADLTGTSDLTLRSGVLLTVPTTAGSITPNLRAIDGATNRTLQIFTNGDVNLTGTVTTTAGLFKSGNGGLILSANNSATLSGPIHFHEGNFLRLTSTTSVNPASPIRFDGPNSTNVLQLVFPDNGTYDLQNPIQLANIGTAGSSFSTGTVAGALALNTTIRLTGLITSDANTPSLQSTPITLTGETATKSNVFRFENPGNTFRGNIRVVNSSLEIVNNGGLGDPSNAIEAAFASATVGGIRFAAALSLPRSLIISNTTRFDTNGFNAAFTGVVSGTSIMHKVGNGVLTFSNPGNTYTGTVNVDVGELRINGVLNAGTAVVTVNNTATLSGNGTIYRPITVTAAATLAPGDGGGTLTATRATTINGILQYEAGDLLQVGPTGTLSLGAASVLAATGLNGTSTYIVAQFPTGALTGVFSNATVGTYTIQYTPTQIVLNPVPEPASVLLIGAAAFGIWRRKTRKCDAIA